MSSILEQIELRQGDALPSPAPPAGHRFLTMQRKRLVYTRGPLHSWGPRIPFENSMNV